MTTKRALIFGEVLFDIFEDGEAILGGAPFNVAWHLHGFGAQPIFVSRIGEDELGIKVIEAMQAWGMDETGMQLDADHPTGTVRVTLQSGQPSFNIEEQVAYDYIDTEQILHIIESPPALIYHGSLITRHPNSRHTLFALREAQTSPLFIDINLRQPWHRKQQAEPILKGITWLKLNADELEVFAEKKLESIEQLEAAAKELLQQFDMRFMVVTMGGDGAFLVGADGIVHSPPAPTEDLVDTVGAGDALSSVILFGILNAWDMETTLKRAVGFATAICEQKGATSFNKQLYKRFLQEWNC